MRHSLSHAYTQKQPRVTSRPRSNKYGSNTCNHGRAPVKETIPVCLFALAGSVFVSRGRYCCEDRRLCVNSSEEQDMPSDKFGLEVHSLNFKHKTPSFSFSRGRRPSNRDSFAKLLKLCLVKLCFLVSTFHYLNHNWFFRVSYSDGRCKICLFYS